MKNISHIAEQQTITLHNGVPRNPSVRLAEPVSIGIGANEQIAIIGRNAGGKSLLADILTGKYLLREGSITYDFRPSADTAIYSNIKYIAFRDTYGSADACYQMRWNQTEQDDVPLTRELLGNPGGSEWQERLFTLFHIQPMLDKKIVSLSSGELRKFQITKALLTKPRILMMDNPYIGLDAHTRKSLTSLLTTICQMNGVQIILVISILDDVPEFITHTIHIEGGKVVGKQTREKYLREYRESEAKTTAETETKNRELTERIATLPYAGTNYTGEEVIRMDSVSIRYGKRTILRNLDWTVRRGEKWSLSGENGSGKSTLLSLVCADNPQSYACDISLFGHRRGHGESIWDIKKHIGYVSPEMHRSYMRNIPAIDIVASGLHDSIGLYVKPHQDQLFKCRFWMEVFGITDKESTSFLQLSSGEQRLVLLARAFVKDPELLILDEPLHGLDTFNRMRVKAIIEAFCHRDDKTLIMVTHYQEELPPSITRHLTLIRNE